MRNISNIKYIDASYFYQKNLPTKLPTYEAYGYVKKKYKDKDIVIEFIKKISDNHGPKQIIKGLIIPANALVSASKNFKIQELRTIKKGSNVSVTWRDVVYVANKPRIACSIIYSEGILEKIAGSYIVLKKPETIKIYPLPIKNHPLKKPKYYMIPKSFITEVRVIE
ncbi:MAG: hypothetical protein ACYC1K_02635 [Minisyncoccota bacterium]